MVVLKLLGTYFLTYIVTISLMLFSESIFTFILTLIINGGIMILAFKYLKISKKAQKIFLLILGTLTFLLFSDVGYFMASMYQNTQTTMLPIAVLNILNILLLPMLPALYIAVEFEMIWFSFVLFPLYLLAIYLIVNFKEIAIFNKKEK